VGITFLIPIPTEDGGGTIIDFWCNVTSATNVPFPSPLLQGGLRKLNVSSLIDKNIDKNNAFTSDRYHEKTANHSDDDSNVDAISLYPVYNKFLEMKLQIPMRTVLLLISRKNSRDLHDYYDGFSIGASFIQAFSTNEPIWDARKGQYLGEFIMEGPRDAEKLKQSDSIVEKMIIDIVTSGNVALKNFQLDHHWFREFLFCLTQNFNNDFSGLRSSFVSKLTTELKSMWDQEKSRELYPEMTTIVAVTRWLKRNKSQLKVRWQKASLVALLGGMLSGMLLSLRSGLPSLFVHSHLPPLACYVAD